MMITTAANEYIKKMIEKNNHGVFRLSVKKTGCSGYAYLPQVNEEINPHDSKHEIENGLIIYIDTAWLHLLQDVQIDYVEENKTGLKQKKLIFTHHNEKGRCGCGESFHLESQ